MVSIVRRPSFYVTAWRVQAYQVPTTYDVNCLYSAVAVLCLMWRVLTWHIILGTRYGLSIRPCVADLGTAS